MKARFDILNRYDDLFTPRNRRARVHRYEQADLSRRYGGILKALGSQATVHEVMRATDTKNGVLEHAQHLFVEPDQLKI